VSSGNAGQIAWSMQCAGLMTKETTGNIQENALSRILSKNVPYPASGLLNGSAGIGLTLLSLVDNRHNSWFNLL
jgi:hypothetical protein